MAHDAIRMDFSALGNFAKNVRKDLNDASQAMPAIAEAIKFEVDETFLKGGAVPGQFAWEELSEKTIEGRRRGPNAKSPPYKILVDSGVLAESMATREGVDWAEVFSDNPYLPAHRSGNFLPIRDPFDIDEDALTEEATEMLFQYFRRRQ